MKSSTGISVMRAELSIGDVPASKIKIDLMRLSVIL